MLQEFLLKNFVRECVNHSQLSHPNNVQLVGVYFPPDYILVMEHLQVSLAQYLNDATLPLKLKYDILLDVANGLELFAQQNTTYYSSRSHCSKHCSQNHSVLKYLILVCPRLLILLSHTVTHM